MCFNVGPRVCQPSDMGSGLQSFQHTVWGEVEVCSGLTWSFSNMHSVGNPVNFGDCVQIRGLFTWNANVLFVFNAFLYSTPFRIWGPGRRPSLATTTIPQILTDVSGVWISDLSCKDIMKQGY